MQVDGVMGRARILGMIALGLVAAVLQGLVVFWMFAKAGSFLSLAGLESTLAPAGVELVLAVVVLKNMHELHTHAVSNPHSVLGQALRHDANTPPTPPPTREAWKGGFEDMDRASDKMAKDR